MENKKITTGIYDFDFETHVNGDPTLRYLLRESKFDYKLLEHQVNVRCGAINVAIGQFIDKKYPSK